MTTGVGRDPFVAIGRHQRVVSSTQGRKEGGDRGLVGGVFIFGATAESKTRNQTFKCESPRIVVGELSALL